jgi:hypothetical protein
VSTANITIRPLGYDGGVLEEGRCTGCRQELPNPVNTPKTRRPVPVLIFLDSSPGPGSILGLCRGCMDDVRREVTYAPAYSPNLPRTPEVHQ